MAANILNSPRAVVSLCLGLAPLPGAGVEQSEVSVLSSMVANSHQLLPMLTPPFLTIP
jgi:hypothetical protein